MARATWQVKSFVFIVFSFLLLSCGKETGPDQSDSYDKNPFQIYNRAITANTDIGFVPLPESPVSALEEGADPRSLAEKDLVDTEKSNRASGYVLTQFGYINPLFKFLLRDTNNSLVSGGYWTLVNQDFFIKRNLLSGAIDSSFNASGALTSSVSTGNDQANAAVLQTDGKIVAAGYSTGTDADFALARYTTDGKLDTTFQTSGKVNSSISTGGDLSYAAVLQTDGKVVAAGQGMGTNYDFALVRYTTDGKLDTAFRTSGKVNTSISTGVDNSSSAVLQTDGKVVAVGSGVGGDYDFALARYTTDGQLDTTFRTSGKLLSSISTGGDSAFNAVLQTDGKVVAAGYGFGTDFDFALARYTTDGTLDTSFFTSGKLLTSLGTSTDVVYGIGLQANGKILVAGLSTTGATGFNSYSIARYSTNGRLDTTFKTSGKFISSITGQGDIVYAVKFDPSTGYLYGAGQAARFLEGNAANAGSLFLLLRIAP